MWKTVLIASALLMILGLIGFISSYAFMMVVGTKSGSIAKSYSEHSGWLTGGSRVVAFGLAGHPKRALVTGILRVSFVLALIGIIGMMVGLKRTRQERAELKQQSSSR